MDDMVIHLLVQPDDMGKGDFFLWIGMKGNSFYADKVGPNNQLPLFYNLQPVCDYCGTTTVWHSDPNRTGTQLAVLGTCVIFFYFFKIDIFNIYKLGQWLKQDWLFFLNTDMDTLISELNVCQLKT